MKHQWNDLKYDKDLECWFVVYEGKEMMMHCGEWFNLCIGKDRGIPCRLELGHQWYVVMGPQGVSWI